MLIVWVNECPYYGRCKRFFRLRALVPPTQAAEIQRERKTETLRSDETPDLIHHWYTNTTTVTDNVTGGRNRKIWRFLGSVWESFHDRVPLACRRDLVYSLSLWQTRTRIHILPLFWERRPPRPANPRRYQHHKKLPGLTKITANNS